MQKETYRLKKKQEKMKVKERVDKQKSWQRKGQRRNRRKQGWGRGGSKIQEMEIVCEIERESVTVDGKP